MVIVVLVVLLVANPHVLHHAQALSERLAFGDQVKQVLGWFAIDVPAVLARRVLLGNEADDAGAENDSGGDFQDDGGDASKPRDLRCNPCCGQKPCDGKNGKVAAGATHGSTRVEPGGLATTTPRSTT